MRSIIAILKGGTMEKLTDTLHPFWVMVNKEVRDHVRSWRFIILLFLILVTCFGSLYTSVTNLPKSIKANDPEGTYLFLRLFDLFRSSCLHKIKL